MAQECKNQEFEPPGAGGWTRWLQRSHQPQPQPFREPVNCISLCKCYVHPSGHTADYIPAQIKTMAGED